MRKLLLFKKLIIVILFVGMSLAGWAQVILYEPFDYATPAFIGGNGSDVGASSNNWTTHSMTVGQTTTVDIQDGSLTYAGLASSTGNKVFLFSNKGATSRDVNRAITSTAKVLYFSVLVNIIDTVQLKGGDYFMHFGGTAGSAVGSPNVGARLGAKLTSTPTASTFRFTIQNNSGGTPSFTENSEDLNVGTTYLVVVKLDLSAAISVTTMWVNPASLGGAEPAGGIANSTGTNTFTSFASICLRDGFVSAKANIDEIRVGATFADVTPISAVGINKRDQAVRQTSIYPNPAKSFFSVKAPEGKYLVSVNNSIGSLVKTTDLNTTGKIEMSDLHPGIYYVTVENVKTNQKEVHKLIVR